LTEEREENLMSMEQPILPAWHIAHMFYFVKGKTLVITHK